MIQRQHWGRRDDIRSRGRAAPCRCHAALTRFPAVGGRRRASARQRSASCGSNAQQWAIDQRAMRHSQRWECRGCRCGSAAAPAGRLGGQETFASTAPPAQRRACWPPTKMRQVADTQVLHEVELLINGENDDGAKKPHVDCYRCRNRRHSTPGTRRAGSPESCSNRRCEGTGRHLLRWQALHALGPQGGLSPWRQRLSPRLWMAASQSRLKWRQSCSATCCRTGGQHRGRRETHGECRNCDTACRTVRVLLQRRSLKGCDNARDPRAKPGERGCARPRWAHSVLATGRIECHGRGATGRGGWREEDTQ